MNVHARIASLHRELAEAYEELASPKRRKPTMSNAPGGYLPSYAPADDNTKRQVRTRLRRQGVKA